MANDGALAAIGAGAAITSVGAGALGASLDWLTFIAHDDQKACSAVVVDTLSPGLRGVGLGIENLNQRPSKPSPRGHDLGSALFGVGGLATGTFDSEPSCRKSH